MRLTVLYILFPLFVTPIHSFSIPWKFMTSSAIKHVKSLDLDEDCAADLESLILDASDFKLWALKMLDASGKLNSGILLGHVLSLGDYDECLSVKETVRGREIIGQYCGVCLGIPEHSVRSIPSKFFSEQVLMDRDYKNVVSMIKNTYVVDPGNILPEIKKYFVGLIGLGICVPKTCSITDLEKVLVFIEKKWNFTEHVPMFEEVCVSKDTPLEFTTLDIGIYCFLGTVFLIVLICTIYDIHLRHSGQNSNILVIFSAYTNAKRLFSYSSSSQNILDCLDGIRVLSAFWVFWGHAEILFGGMSRNGAYIFLEWKNNPWNNFTWSGFYAVDNFFTIGGLLLTYTYLRISKTTSINFSMLCWARYLRLTPALLAVTLMYAGGMKLVADGPFARFMSKSFTKCSENRWWGALFHFIGWPEAQTCVIQVWFIAANDQLFVCTSLALIFLKKYPRSVMVAFALAFLTGVIYSSVITITESIGFVPFLYDMDVGSAMFYKPLYHAPSWVVGAIFGYLLHEKQITISRSWNLVLWSISSLTMLKLVFDQLIFFHEDFNVYRNVLWNALARPTWSLALCLMITSCATGNGGLINSFLTHPIFRILRRLSYSFYLLHNIVSGINLMNTRQAHYFSTYEVARNNFLFLVITLICSVPFYLAFEAPLDAWRIYNKKVDEDKMKQKIN